MTANTNTFATGEQTRHSGAPKPSFWILAVLLLMIVFASAAATPLYWVYQIQLAFSPTTLTAIFAVYVFVLLVTLLVFGSLSDHLGRRPLIIAALGFSVAASAVFLAADSVGPLFLLPGRCRGLPPGSQAARLARR